MPFSLIDSSIGDRLLLLLESPCPRSRFGENPKSRSLLSMPSSLVRPPSALRRPPPHSSARLNSTMNSEFHIDELRAPHLSSSDELRTPHRRTPSSTSQFVRRTPNSTSTNSIYSLTAASSPPSQRRNDVAATAGTGQRFGVVTSKAMLLLRLLTSASEPLPSGLRSRRRQGVKEQLLKLEVM